jgi:TadE-like protein
MALDAPPQPANSGWRGWRGRIPFIGRQRGRGQSLVEFAISIPLVLLMLLFGIDFGRVFLGWVTLNNTVREAANYAALYPTAWGSPATAASHPEYVRLIGAESTGINCSMPATLPPPTFPNGTDIGSPAVVAITCRFSLITPVIKNILGNPISVSSSASFPIRSGVIAGIPVGSGLPQGTPTPSQPPGSQPPGSPTPAPTPVPNCIVPDFKDVDTTLAATQWTNAGFSGNLVYNPLVPPAFTIKKQSLNKGTSWPCTSPMTVSAK